MCCEGDLSCHASFYNYPAGVGITRSGTSASMQDVADAWRGYADVTDEHRVPPRQEGQGHDTPRSPRALTQQLRLRSQRARAQVRTLTEANQRMGEFLGTATHELKTPV